MGNGKWWKEQQAKARAAANAPKPAAVAAGTPWSVHFTGLASEAKSWLENEYDALKAQYAPEAEMAMAQAKTIFTAFVGSVKEDAQVALAAAKSDASADALNVVTSTTNHPPATSGS